MANADHEWVKCPHMGVTEPNDVDLKRQNHFYHDSLGCPFECTEDHNHPTPKGG